jgi:hypothetical protein
MVLWVKGVRRIRAVAVVAVPEYRAREEVPLHILVQPQSTAEGQEEMEKIPPEMAMVRRAVPPAEEVVEPEDPQLDPKPWEERVERDRLF